MFQVGQSMFVSVGGGARTLDPVEVAGVEGGAVRLVFVDEVRPEEVRREGERLMLFFQGAEGFMQQPAAIVEPVSAEGAVVVATTGEAVSGESRQFFRVSTVLCAYEAEVEGTSGCRIVDASSMGVAVVCDFEREIGDPMGVSFVLKGRRFSGECVVQSVRETRAGWRLGLLCVSGSGDLGDGVHALTMDAQRDQLRRIAGAA